MGEEKIWALARVPKSKTKPDQQTNFCNKQIIEFNSEVCVRLEEVARMFSSPAESKSIANRYESLGNIQF